MDNYSLSDLAAVTKDADGWGGGAWWIIILFLFVFMGGGWGNRQGELGTYATAASQQEILFGQQFGRIDDRLTNIGNGICNLGYEMQGSIGQLGKEMALAQNGTNMAIPGATASAAAAAGAPTVLSFPALVRQACCASGSALTLVLTGAAATVNNVALRVQRI